MVVLGLGSLIFAALMLYRRGDIKRLFAYSSIEHMGIIAFAFGMGGALGNFAGLMQMVMHSLTKSAIFFSVGHIAQVKGTQKISEIRGLTTSHPLLGWTLVAGVVAITGLPPFGIFMSEFLLLTATFARAPGLAVLAAIGLMLAFGALLLRVGSLAFGEPTGATTPVRATSLPIFTHLALVLIAGVYIPAAMVAWFQNVALLLK
jgi:hydrogenase-4 component F